VRRAIDESLILGGENPEMRIGCGRKSVNPLPKMILNLTVYF